MPRGKYSTYTREMLEEAVTRVQAGELSQRGAAKQYGIPLMTVSDHVNGKVVPGAKAGAKTVLTSEIERALAEKLVKLADLGFGLTRRLVMAKAKELCDDLNLPNPFKDIAGRSWYRGFMKRNKDILTLRKPSKLSTPRGRAMNRDAVNNYFEDLKNAIEGVTYDCVWNMDESGFNLEHTPTKIICRRGDRSVNARVSSMRQNVTVIACANGAGQVMPPHFIVRGKTERAKAGFREGDGPLGAEWDVQEKAWMSDSMGPKWFRKIFLKHCGPIRPQVLILDQHHSHEAYDFLALARENDVLLFALPPHTTHWLQPLDKGCFSALTQAWRTKCTEFMAFNKNNVINKATFARVFTQAWVAGMTAENVRTGFRVTGICPFNPSAIPD